MEQAITIIEREIKEHEADLNNGDFDHYKGELCIEDEDVTVAEAVENADIDSTEFNIGFEQGYMRGLQVALSELKK